MIGVFMMGMCNHPYATVLDSSQEITRTTRESASQAQAQVRCPTPKPQVTV